MPQEFLYHLGKSQKGLKTQSALIHHSKHTRDYAELLSTSYRDVRFLEVVKPPTEQVLHIENYSDVVIGVGGGSVIGYGQDHFEREKMYRNSDHGRWSTHDSICNCMGTGEEVYSHRTTSTKDGLQFADKFTSQRFTVNDIRCLVSCDRIFLIEEGDAPQQKKFKKGDLLN